MRLFFYQGAPAPGFGAPPAGERPQRPARSKFLLTSRHPFLTGRPPGAIGAGAGHRPLLQAAKRFRTGRSEIRRRRAGRSNAAWVCLFLYGLLRCLLGSSEPARKHKNHGIPCAA